jgi:hypothetical protein
MYKEISSIKPDDKRIPKWESQIAERGFDDTEWWSLYDTIARFTLPRLKVFRTSTMSFPLSITSDEWDGILDKMILAFEIIVDDDKWPASSNEDSEIVEEGIELFGKWFLHLWS